MQDRKPLVAGNWKMNKTVSEARELAGAVRSAERPDGVCVVLCPPFPALVPVADALRGSKVALGAQNAHWERSGAFTGEVSAAMLVEAGCRYVILGHSERRRLFGETDESVARRMAAVLGAGLVPILCVGETLVEREAGRVREVLDRQTRGALSGLPVDSAGRMVLAYEPVWAIGTGRHAEPQQAQEAHAFLRSRLADLAGPDAAGVPILYGGSVTPSNARDLFAQPDIDGGLIGGASLDASAFLDIVRAAG